MYAGTCTGIVVNTGDRTVMGRVARLTGSIVEESMIKSHSLLLSLLPQFSSIAVGEKRLEGSLKICVDTVHIFCPQHLRIDRQTDRLTGNRLDQGSQEELNISLPLASCVWNLQEADSYYPILPSPFWLMQLRIRNSNRNRDIPLYPPDHHCGYSAGGLFLHCGGCTPV